MDSVEMMVRRIASQVNLPIEAVRAVLAALPDLGYRICEGRE